MATSGQYGTTIENCNKVFEKAKTKNDGVYKFNGLFYKVNKHRVTHLAAYGKIYEFYYGFLAIVGEYPHTSGCDTKVKQILKNL